MMIVKGFSPPKLAIKFWARKCRAETARLEWRGLKNGLLKLEEYKQAIKPVALVTIAYQTYY